MQEVSMDEDNVLLFWLKIVLHETWDFQWQQSTRLKNIQEEKNYVFVVLPNYIQTLFDTVKETFNQLVLKYKS